uniref:Uncharacterized protein n=1 Tax=Zooxanthella nutricula TaxID=1333877 RepID=A0A7S2VGQ0_9DINO
MDVLVVDGAVFHAGGTSGAEKARILKRALRIPDAEALLPTVGEQGRCMLVRETEDEWELLIPHGYLERARIEERPICHFRRHAQMPCTAAWIAAGEDEGGAGCWERWPSGPVLPERLQELAPDLDPERALGAALRNPGDAP